jgi:processive 1,2-diacylglycerol beta-glucosyltransferase
MPKVLILHASWGSGHRGAANALAGAFSHLGASVRVEDGFDYAAPWVRAIFVEAYPRLCERRPNLWRWIYEGTDCADLQRAYRTNTLWGAIQRPAYSRLEALIHEIEPDVLVCTQQFPLLVVRALCHQKRISTPYYVVITDVTAHSSWLNEGAAGYFLADTSTREDLAARGVPDPLLHVTGIPVQIEIGRPKPMVEMRHKLGLPPNRRVVALFGGGIRPARVRTMVEGLLSSPEPLVCLTVAGRNHRLAQALSDLDSSPRVDLRKHAQIDHVDDLVAASDLVVTKAGGMISSEVLARGTPMIVVDPIPGQEEWNADWIALTGAGIQIRRPEMVPIAIQALLAQPDRLRAMRAEAQRVGRPRAALEIAQHVLDAAGG